MSKLKRLAKLKQKGRETSVEQYLMAENRQNLLAIEAAFAEESDSVIASLKDNLVTNNQSYVAGYGTIIDQGSQLSGNNLILKDDGDYLFSLSFNGLNLRNQQSLVVSFFLNQAQVFQTTIASNQNANLMVTSPSLDFFQSLKRQDTMYFVLSSISLNGAITDNITWSSGLLKMVEI